MTPTPLARSIGLPGATLLGLGSILGTGVFVSIGLAAGAAGGWVVVATVIAGLLAAANALSSAQLAAAHPVSGGTYEYGYRLLTPSLGFAAGWMFLCAKCASAATAALGFAGYLIGAFGFESSLWSAAVAVGAVVVLTALVLSGIRRSSAVNAAIVVVTIAALVALIAAAAATVPSRFTVAGLGLDHPIGLGLFEASALMFVAFTGYGRIATMGEEVRDPQRTIPRAIITTLVVSAAIYIAVAIAAVATLGADGLAASTLATGAPLEDAARALGFGWLAGLIVIGATTAMLGVLLNLILGLSRVVLAMGRRGDAPAIFGRVDARGAAPVAATIAVGIVIAAIAAAGSIKLAWSFSAFTVLVYYAITNLAALRLPADRRLYPRWTAWAGLIGCLGLAWWVDDRAWMAGIAVLAAGFALRFILRRLS